MPRPEDGGALRVRKMAPAQAQLNDIVLYRLEVANVGRVRLRNVTLTDVLPEGIDPSNTQPGISEANPLVWRLGDLEPGQTREVRYDALLKKAGDLVNKAIAEAAGGIRQETNHTIRVGNPVLALTLTGPQRGLMGRPVTYQLTITNPGTAPASNVELNDELVKEVEFLSATKGGRLDGNVVRWSLGTLLPGGRRIVRLTVRARDHGTFKNVATVNADRGLVEQSIMRTRFVEATGLDVEIEKGEDPIEVGQESSFTVRLINAGKEAETKVRTTITLPDGLVIVEAPRAEVSGQKVTLPPLAQLPPGTEPRVTIRFRADRSGEAVVSVEAVSDRTGPANPIKAEETFRVVPTPPGTSLKSTRGGG
jgi:uncharacterized repeat protein (TIGR01451 family)